MKNETEILKKLNQLFEYEQETGNFIRKTSGRGKNHTKGFVAGCLRSDGYIIISINSKTYLSHRLVWLYIYGVWPKDQIDHINGNYSDNRISNLREASNSENNQNLREAKVTNKLGLLGVSIDRQGYISARIQINGKQKHLGMFKTAELAHNAYLEAKRKIHPYGTL